MSQCKYCQEQIEWTKSGDRSIPMNPDGSRHQCKGSQKPAPVKSQEPVKMYHTGTLKSFMNPNIIVTDDKRGDITLYAKEKWALIENIPVGSRVEYSFNNVGNLATITTTSAPMPSPAFKTGNEIKKEIEQGAKPDPVPATVQPTSTSTSPSPAQQPATAMSGTQIWTGEIPKFGVEVKVNLNDYESIGFWISGTLPDAEKLRHALSEEMGRYAQNHPLTRDLIDAYRKRVLA